VAKPRLFVNSYRKRVTELGILKRAMLAPGKLCPGAVMGQRSGAAGFTRPGCSLIDCAKALRTARSKAHESCWLERPIGL
jgi:hypothetical protein